MKTDSKSLLRPCCPSNAPIELIVVFSEHNEHLRLAQFPGGDSSCVPSRISMVPKPPVFNCLAV